MDKSKKNAIREILQSANGSRHDIAGLKSCPNTGEPFDGYSWTRQDPYDTCRQCCKPDDPMAAGLAENLARLNRNRAT